MAAFLVVNVAPSVISFILIVFSLMLSLVYYFKRRNSYWKRRGVPYANPSLFFGNVKDLILQRVPIAFVYQQIYKELDGHTFGGYYRCTTPSLMLRDPDIIKMFLVKNFSYFHDRALYMDEALDPLSANLLNLTGQRWKNVRYKLMTTFSSRKLKLMHDLLNDCIGELDSYLTDATKDNSKTSGVQNLRELMDKVTMDVIGSCTFGFRCNSIRDENSEFRRIGRLIFKPSFRSRLRNMLRFISPRLISFFKVKEVHPEVEEFFMSVLAEAVIYRETSAQKRNDFLQLMLDIQAEEKRQLESDHRQQQNETQVENENTDKKLTESSPDILFTDNIIASNAFQFFSAGFDTTASTLSYCLYELAVNPEICEKVRLEVESVKTAHNGNLDYDAMKELVYTESVISESLRKHPTGPLVGRRCTKTFQIPGTSIVIEEGTHVNICIYGLHHDPKYFPEPDKFLPERFSEGNKDAIIPGTYMPFGDGPRTCVAMRFSMFVVKSVLSHIVSNFTVHPCEKTDIPLKFDRRTVSHKPEGGIWVQFQRISK